MQDGFDPRNVIRIPESGKGILACEQALQGAPAAERESLQLRLWNLNICIQKVDAKCWLAEMTLAMTSLPLARVFQCLFTFARLVEIRQFSWQGATGELEVEFKFQRHSCIIYSPSFSPVNLHRSKPLISLVPFNLHFHCFQGSGHCYVTIPVVFPANQKQSFK